MKTKLITLTLALFSIFSIQAQDKKVAVVGFYTDKIIGYDSLDEENQGLISAMASLPFNPDYKLDGIFEKFHAKFFKDYAPKLPFKVIEEDSILNDSSYINFKTPKRNYKTPDSVLVYDGYKYMREGFLAKRNAKAIAATLKDKSDGVMFVTVDFNFTNGTGIGGTRLIRIKANVRMTVYNSQGKKVYTFKEGARSKKTITMLKRVPIIKANKIMSLCDDALNRLMKDLDKKIAKVTKKAGDKL